MRYSYYLPYEIAADVNYIFLLQLWGLAAYRPETQSYDCVCYSSIGQLAEVLKISYSTLNRYLKSQEYNRYFAVDKANKRIILNCHFIKPGKSYPFIRLTSREYEYFLGKADSFLIKYYLYIKYFCGKQCGSNDFTAKQFLSAIGYCENSKSYQGKLSHFNRLLVDDGFITISKYRDSLGNERNTYKIKQ